MPEDCHSALAQLIGPEMEPISVIHRVEEHRAYWRPETTRLVLLAESHVYTTIPADWQSTVLKDTQITGMSSPASISPSCRISQKL